MMIASANSQLPEILDGIKEAFGVLFYAPDLGGMRFWLHVVVGLVVLIVAGKLFLRWIGNVETRGFPLAFALLVPLLAWVLAWAAADVWLVELAGGLNPLLIKHAAALVLALLFACFVVFWSDAITRTHAAISLFLAYLCFGIAIFCTDLAVGSLADGAQVVDQTISGQAADSD